METPQSRPCSSGITSTATSKSSSVQRSKDHGQPPDRVGSNCHQSNTTANYQTETHKSHSVAPAEKHSSSLERLLGLISSWMQCTLIPADEGPEYKPKVLFTSSKMPAPVHVWSHLHQKERERNHFTYRAPQGRGLILIFPFLTSSSNFFS